MSISDHSEAHVVFTASISEQLILYNANTDFVHEGRSNHAGIRGRPPHQVNLAQCGRLHNCPDHQQLQQGTSINSDTFDQQNNQQQQRLTLD